MADILPSIQETHIFAALRTFILSLVACEVVRVPTNRVPMPVGDFIAMSRVDSVPLSTNVHAYTATTETILRPAQYTIQVDCYGSLAGDRAATISAMLRDDYAVQSFKTSGYDIQPLYAGDAKPIPLVDGEDQYESRWMFNTVLQYNPVVTIAAETANTLVAGTLNVDRSYPP